MALNTEFPSWLRTEVPSWEQHSQNVNSAFMTGYKNALDKDMRQINLASGLLQLQGQQNQLDLTKLKIQQTGEGNEEVAAWMRETGGNPVYMVNLPYQGVNPVAAETISDAQLRASQSLLVQKAKQSITDFNTRLAALPSDAAMAIGQMSDDPKTGLPSHMKLRALSVAEQANNLRIKNEADAAAITAEQRGDLATTVVGEKGVTTTYRPAPSATAKDVKPRELTLSDGSTIVYNPNTGAFRFKAKTGQEKEMSHAQLLGVAKHLQETDFEDPNARKIQDFLSSEAVKQIDTAVRPIAPTATPASGVKKYNPATGRIE